MEQDTRTRQYRQTSVQTADRGKLLLMVYDVAISSLQEAGRCMDCQDHEAKGRHMDKAFRAVGELRKSLNMERGKDIARNLDRLYDFMMHRMTEANFNNQSAHLDVVLNILGDLRETWTQVVRQQAAEGEEPASVPQSSGFLA